MYVFYSMAVYRHSTFVVVCTWKYFSYTLIVCVYMLFFIFHILFISKMSIFSFFNVFFIATILPGKDFIEIRKITKANITVKRGLKLNCKVQMHVIVKFRKPTTAVILLKYQCCTNWWKYFYLMIFF